VRLPAALSCISICGPKFDRGNGWPSFFAGVDAQAAITTIEDHSHGIVRSLSVDYSLARCEAHLGHLFHDGPAPRAACRYCVNSASAELPRPRPGVQSTSGLMEPAFLWFGCLRSPSGIRS